MATAVVTAGIAAPVARSPLVLTVLTVVGAAYLVWLGVGMLTQPSTVQSGTDTAGGSRRQQAVRRLGISGPNPKVFLLFLAPLPQFTRPDTGWPAGVQIAVLGSVHVAGRAVI